jgi:hypothetical protein
VIDAVKHAELLHCKYCCDEMSTGQLCPGARCLWAVLVSICWLRKRFTRRHRISLPKTFVGPRIVIYCCRKNQLDAPFFQIYFELTLYIFRRSFRPSSGFQDCTYSNRHMSNGYCYLLVGKQVTVSV